jgi:hypothetical protein
MVVHGVCDGDDDDVQVHAVQVGLRLSQCRCGSVSGCSGDWSRVPLVGRA